MAQVKKLMIQGIRSFSADDDNGQVIEFYSPMTLIVGSNGCGKTTIIESLKYGFTGEYPPNTKNGAFINDPKLGSGTESRGMVRVELLDKKGDRVVVARRLKGTTSGKQGNVSVTKMEHTVAHYVSKPDGTTKKYELSSKCVDIEEMVRRVVGVSKPILNHVIFCHQEDSCWPLDEGKKVKEYFDAIFNTTMYVKALKTLQDKEKAMGVDISKTRMRFGHTADYLQTAQTKNGELEEKRVVIRSMTDEISQHERKIEEFTEKINAMEKLQGDYAAKQFKVAEKKGQIRALEQSIEELRDKVREPFDGDMEALERKIAQFQFVYEQQCQAHDTAMREKSETEKQRNDLDQKHQTFVIKEGVFKSNKNLNDRKIEEMGTIMENLRVYIQNLKDSSQSQGERFSIPLDSVLMSLNADLDSVDARTAVKALESAVTSKSDAYKKLKDKLDADEKKLQDKKTELNKSQQDILTQVREKQKSETQLKVKIEELRAKLDSLNQSNDKLVELHDKEESIREKIERLEKSELTKRFSAEISKLTEDIEELEKRKRVLQEQNVLLRTDDQLRNKIKMAQEHSSKTEKDCKQILRRVEPQLRSVVSAEETVPQDNLNPFVKQIEDKLNKEVKAKTAELDKMKLDNAKAETMKKQADRELEKKQKEVEQITRKSETVLQGASFVDEYASIFNDTESAQAEVKETEAASCLYQLYVNKLTKKSCCPLCKRDFAKEAENKALVETLTKTMKKMEEAKPEQESKLEALRQKQELLVKLKPNWDLKEKLESKEIPELIQKKKEYEIQIKSFASTMAELSDTLSVLSIDKASATSLLSETALYDNHRKQQRDQEALIAKVEAQRDPKAKELGVTLNDVQIEQDNVDGTITDRRREKERKEKMMNDNISALNKAKDEINEVVRQGLKIKSLLQDQDAMETRKREYEKESGSIRATVQDLNKNLPRLKDQVDSVEKEISDQKKKADEDLSLCMKEKQDLVNKKSRVSLLDQEIQAFKRESKEFEVEVERHRRLETERAKVSKKIEELEAEIGILDTEVKSQEFSKRNLEDCKSLKQKEASRNALQAEIATDSKIIDRAKIQGLQTQINEESTKLKKITERKNQSVGSMRTVNQVVRDLEKELADPKYANAEKNHRENLIRRTVLERAQKDVRLYRLALETAVMTFHKKKMEAINRYLKFYWKKIYRGNDIDFIAIRTSNEEEGKPNTVKLDMSKIERKNYSYRVVAYRRGVELDMRGRCSAGQKILASIIIRLSLAQTFTAHCGIITLDEPTTNLDRQNIESLASTLCDLAVGMREHKTFQLVVITHDQQFIDSLLRIDPIEYYFKVKRDHMGFSQIERISK